MEKLKKTIFQMYVWSSEMQNVAIITPKLSTLKCDKLQTSHLNVFPIPRLYPLQVQVKFWHKREEDLGSCVPGVSSTLPGVSLH